MGSLKGFWQAFLGLGFAEVCGLIL